MRIALLINPDSGRGRANEVERLLRGHGARVESFPISEHDRAVASGPDRMAIAGGDGSIACVAEAAGRAGVPLAVIPTGTANDFATGAGTPAGVEAASELAVRGERRRSMEIGRAGERPFVNLTSVGLSPVAADHAHGLKRRLGALAYPLGAIRAGLTARPVACHVDADGRRRFDGEAWQVSVACTGAFGGGASLETDAEDGRVDLVVIEAGGRRRLVKHAYGMRAGTVERQRGVVSERCGRVELSLREGGRLNVDGELVDAAELAEGDTIAFRAEADAFELIVG